MIPRKMLFLLLVAAIRHVPVGARSWTDLIDLLHLESDERQVDAAIEDDPFYFTMSPTISPTFKKVPSRLPSTYPTSVIYPSLMPSESPSLMPTVSLSGFPSVSPSITASSSPSYHPSLDPSFKPSSQPTITASSMPSGIPSDAPTNSPTALYQNANACPPGRVLHYVTLIDLTGDGWEGTEIAIGVASQFNIGSFYVFKGTLEEGAESREYVCLDPDVCYRTKTVGGSWTEEVRWTVREINLSTGLPGTAIAKGGAPEDCVFSIPPGDIFSGEAACESTCVG